MTTTIMKAEPRPRPERTILVVDDEKEICLLLQRTLRREGYRVLRAGGARRALATLKREPVNLMILDIRMPGLSGLDVLRKVRSSRNPPRVVMLTAHGHLDSARQAMQLGAYDYITKPFDLEFVKGIVEEAVS